MREPSPPKVDRNSLKLRNSNINDHQLHQLPLTYLYPSGPPKCCWFPPSMQVNWGSSSHHRSMDWLPLVVNISAWVQCVSLNCFAPLRRCAAPVGTCALCFVCYCAAALLLGCAALLRCCFLAPVRCCAAALLLGFACASALLRCCAAALLFGCSCDGALLRCCGAALLL